MTFGDAGPDDSYDPTARADPEQVARRLHELRRQRGDEPVGWDDLTAGQRLGAVGIMAALLDWLRREGTRP